MHLGSSTLARFGLGHGALAAAVACAVLGACGSPPPPDAPKPAASAAPVHLPEAHADLVAVPAPSSAPSATPPPALGNNVPIRPSALLAEVQKIGVDTTKPLSSIPLPQKKQLMKLFKQALGYDSCTGCHVADQYEKPTRNKAITRKMWDTFLVQLRDDKGGPLFCDSCHGGKAKSLDRSAMEGLQRIMETDYQGKLTRADKQPHDCSTCHGKGQEPEPKIIEKLWGIPN
jgi:hypothetical protein